MKNIYELSRDIVDNKIISGIKFTFKELLNEIKEKNGIMRISPGCSISKYLSILEENGIINYYPSENDKGEYIPVEYKKIKNKPFLVRI